MITIKKTGLFLENEIDLALFTTLTDENLLSIGVLAFGARKIMTNAMKGRIFFSYSGKCLLHRFPVSISNNVVLICIHLELTQ